jgi:hypothetical protein
VFEGKTPRLLILVEEEGPRIQGVEGFAIGEYPAGKSVVRNRPIGHKYQAFHLNPRILDPLNPQNHRIAPAEH